MTADAYNRWHCKDLRQCWPQLTDPLPDQPAPFFLGLARIRSGFLSPVPGRTVTNTHWLHLQLAGEAAATLASGITVPLPAGHAVLHSSDAPFPVVRYHQPMPGLIFCIMFTGSPARILADGLMRRYGPIHPFPENHPAVSPLVALGKPRPRALPHPPLGAAYGAKLILDMLLALQTIGHGGSSASPDQADLADLLARHPQASLAQIARLCDCSREHFSRTFHRLHGVTTAVFRRRLRLQQALGLFSSDLALDAIAHQVGFATCSGFQRAFRREFGVAPAVLRGRHTPGR